MKKIMMVLNHIEEIIASALLIITSFLVFIQAILRYQFNYSLFWSEEISRMMIVWFIFLGSSIAVREKAHVNMDALPNIATPFFKHVLELMVTAVCIIFTGAIAYAGINMVNSALNLHSTATGTGMPLVIPYMAIPVGLGLMLIRYIIQGRNQIVSFISYLNEGGDK
ncbi:TRAP transporter small permease [Clostridium sp. DL1XJH146]